MKYLSWLVAFQLFWTPFASAQTAAIPGVKKGLEFFRKSQHADGSWTALIQVSSIRYNILTIYLYEYLGQIETKRQRVRDLVRFMWSQQTPSGGFSGYPGGPDNLDISVQAYLAVRMTGVSESDPQMVRLFDAIQKMGGVDKVPPQSQVFLNLFGVRKMADCAPASALTVLMSMDKQLPWVKVLLYPIYYLIGSRQTKTLMPEKYPHRFGPPQGDICSLAPQFLTSQFSGKEKFFSWVEANINSDGTMFDYSPTTVPTLMALSTERERYKDVIDRGVRTLEEYQETKPDGIAQSPGEASVGETCAVLNALLDMGLSANDPMVLKAEKFLYSVQQETFTWGFSKKNAHFPDTDDTSLAAFVLSRLEDMRSSTANDSKILPAMEWVLKQQNRDGGFGTWERDSVPLLNKIFKLAMGRNQFVLSESVPEHTARIVTNLSKFRSKGEKFQKAYDRAVKYLLKKQGGDGEYLGTWFVNYIFGTSQVLTALGTAAPSPETDLAIDRAIGFVLSHQMPDGGFSETLDSYLLGHVTKGPKSSPSQTGLVVSRLLEFSQNEGFRHWPALGPALERAIQFLKRTQGKDGLWHDTTWTGVTFPGIEYLYYAFVQEIEPLHAIGLYEEIIKR